MIPPRLCLIFLAFLALNAQTRPDFGGVWKQDNTRSTKKDDPTFRYSNRIVQTGSRLTVTTMTSAAGKPDYSSTQEFVTDGAPHEVEARGVKGTMTVRWEGETLVFRTESLAGNAEETWALSPDGKTLTKHRRVSGPFAHSDETFVLEKQ